MINGVNSRFGYLAAVGQEDTAALFVYNSSSGELFWNQDGVTSGAGSGGVLAVLENKAPLAAGQFTLY